MNSKFFMAAAAVALLGFGCTQRLAAPPAAVPPPSPAVEQPSITSPTPAPAPPPRPAPSPAPPPTPAPQPKTVTVSMTASGFSPATITISRGDTVEFENFSEVIKWPASGVHPSHQICPGFDALRGILPGGAYSHTFTVAKECPFHDHLNPSVRGMVIVQ